MKNPLLTVCLAVFLLFYAPALVGSQSGQAAAQPEACVPCEGRGEVEETCPKCVGHQHVDCPSCAGFYLSEPSRAQVQLRWQKISSDGKGFTPTPELQILLLENGMQGLGEILARKPGMLVCKGCAIFHDKDKGCKACKDKRFIKCKSCKGRAEAGCVSCSKRGVVTRACHACDGGGEVAALEAWDGQQGAGEEGLLDCPWCSGWGLEDCRNCLGLGKSKQACTHCQGDKKKVCTDCHGFKKPACDGCRGIGKVRSMLEPKAGLFNCPTCRGKGVGTCTSCKRGFQECGPCDGKGKATLPCVHCSGTKELLCGGCGFGSTRSWEELAERCVAAGQVARAKYVLQSGLAYKKREYLLHETRLLEDIEHYAGGGSGSKQAAEAQEEASDEDEELDLLEYPSIKKKDWEWMEPELRKQLLALKAKHRASLATLQAKIDALPPQ